MTYRAFWRGISALATLAVVLSFITPAQASVVSLGSAKVGEAVGLIVHFAPASAEQLSSVKQNAVAAIKLNGIVASISRPLGRGWSRVAFSSVATEEQVALAMQQISTAPGVLAVAPDSVLKEIPAALPRPSSNVARTLSFSAAIKPATGPVSVSAIDAFNSDAPTQPQLRLSWKPPKALFGAKLVGYRVYSKLDTESAWSTLAQQTAATTNSLVVQSFDAGTKVSLRVAAITKLGSKLRVGAVSRTVTATPTTIPKVPIFVGSRLANSKNKPSWFPQTAAEQGGLPVTYTAVASASGYAPVTCETVGTSCEFGDLIQGVNYHVNLSATNARGTVATVDFKPVSDPEFSKQWALTSRYGIDVEGAWERTKGAGAVVAVLDSGYSVHPDLNDQYLKAPNDSVYGYDFVSQIAEPGDGDGWDSDAADQAANTDWHGTHVSGIIAAAANMIGTVGIAPEAKLLETRVLGAQGGIQSDLIAALNWAAGIEVPGVPTNAYPANVINLSLGLYTGTYCDAATEAALRNIWSRNVTVVTSAGNDDDYAKYSYPGNCVPTINVGASNFNGERTWYSNFGDATNISAPGGDDTDIYGTLNKRSGMIYSTGNDGTPTKPFPTYFYMQGTSQAAPMVTAVVALMYSLKPNITPNQVWEALSKSAAPFAPGSYCAIATEKEGCGVGLLNANDALSFVAAGEFKN